MKIRLSHIIGIIITLIVGTLSLVLFWDSRKILYFVLVIAFIAGAIPFLISIINERKKQKELEAKFLEFARDLVENVKSGTPISKSIINLKSRNYGQLSFYVDKLSNQISLGIPLTASLATFAKDTKSAVISRAVSLISEAEKAGGQIDHILESVSNSVDQTEQLKKERKSAVYNLVVQGYIIFMVFILIMIILEFKILPMIPSGGDTTGQVGDIGINMKGINPDDFSMPLLVLLLVQSLFSGLVIGKISEGSLKDGIKHSFILIAITLLVKTGATAFFS